MSDMVEKVAIALFVADGNNPHDAFEWTTNIINERGRDRYRDMARAAIEAMREPTEDMIDATGHWDAGSPKSVWQDMIDAAIGKVDA